MKRSLASAMLSAAVFTAACWVLAVVSKDWVGFLFVTPGIFFAMLLTPSGSAAGVFLAPLFQFLFFTLVCWGIASAGERWPSLRQKQFRGGWTILAVLFVAALIAVRWPPEFVERRQRRAIVEQRLEPFGGLNGLRAECLTLMSNQVPLFWRGSSTNDLLPAFAALRPMEVVYHPELLTLESPNLRAQVVRIKLFGSHSTGGRSSPYYGLEIVHGPDAGKYRPAKKNAVSGNGHQHHRLISEGIYEVY